MFRKVLAIGTLMICAGAALALAQERADGSTVAPNPPKLGTVTAGISPADAPDTFGVTDYSACVIPPSSFHAYNQALGYLSYTDGYIGPQTGDTFRYFEAPVYLPTGALLNGTHIRYYDNDSTGYVWVQFATFACSNGAACTKSTLVQVSSDSSGTPGYTTLSDTGSNGVTWRNYDQSASTINYAMIRAYFSEYSTALKLGPIMIWYQRQISPAPATATFDDVPVGSFGFQQIEALADSGITAGCDSNNFCPNSPLTRIQMAVYLSKALGLHWADWHY